MRDPSQGGAKVSHSPLRAKSRSRSPTNTTLTQGHGAHMVRGVRPHIEPERYATLDGNRNSSPLRQSGVTSATAPPMTELQAESMLRQRRNPGQPSEDEVTSNQAATIMTSVSTISPNI